MVIKAILYYLFSVVFLIGFSNCVEEKDPILEYAEQVLPGQWKIDSVALLRDPSGISYQGNEFFVDTTLFSIGSFEINPFIINSMVGIETSIDCELIVDGEAFPISMNNIFLSGKELWTNFGPNRPPGVYPIETLQQEFCSSSTIFRGNYVVYINDIDHMVFVRSTSGKNSIYMSRI